MAMIGADGLSLLVGDGLMSEGFATLKGAMVTRCEISQRNAVATAIAADAWQVSTGTTARHAVIECDGLATDDAAPLRLRSLMLSGASGNFKLEMNTAETLLFTAVVTLYRETMEAGNVKRLQCRLESTGALVIV
ncbi:MAG: hypothetical protein V4735_01840 [Pseudomonadota bacterium]